MLSRFRDRASGPIRRVAQAIAWTGVSPNVLTFLGSVAGILAALCFARGEQFLAGIILLLSGFFDVIDGAVAGVLKRKTAFGGVLDSVVDRYVDFLIFGGIVYAFVTGGIPEAGLIPGWGWGVLAIAGSFMVSYIRARAEAAGSGKLDVGVAERAERLLILAVGALVGYTQHAVVLIVILTHLTVLHRLIVAWHRLG
ncbi:MAG TPA: CDP-alcohol phosphatidyltransferase family protein [Hadesarchaea archaeon]|nr:CDP-alcohol phosphatidyltransferase family protein [Hadesarchaea archaeon]